jgi:hypothetical protein
MHPIGEAMVYPLPLFFLAKILDLNMVKPIEKIKPQKRLKSSNLSYEIS